MASDAIETPLHSSEQTDPSGAARTLDPRVRIRRLRVLALIAGTLTIVSAACVVALNIAKSSFALVVVGPFYGSQLTVFAWTVGAISVAARLILGATLISLRQRWLATTLKGLVAVVILLGGGLGAVAGFWILAFSTVNTPVHLDSHGHGNYVAMVMTWHHTSVTLYEGDGVVYRPVEDFYGEVPIDSDPFSGGDYSISADGDAVTLHFALSPGGPQNREFKLR